MDAVDAAKRASVRHKPGVGDFGVDTGGAILRQQVVNLGQIS